MDREAFRLSDLSALVQRPDNWLMAVLRGYCDNSGDQSDSSQKCVSIGVYVGTEEQWNYFESHWDMALRKFDLPYLHMKEFGEPSGIYSQLKKSPDDVAKFLSSLVKVIEDAKLTSFGASVLLDGLDRFNNDNGLNLDAYALSLYECWGEIGFWFRDQVVEIFADRFDDVNDKIATADQYLRSNVHRKNYDVLEYVSVSALSRKLNARNTPAIQAADFLAWELHRGLTNDEKWWREIKPAVPKGFWRIGHMIWHAQKSKTKSIEFPFYERKSLNALRKAAPIDSTLVWDYDSLREVNEIRGGVWSV